MFCIRIDAHDLPGEPAVIAPGLGIQKDLDPITDFELICHFVLLNILRPKHKSDPNDRHYSAIDCPLSIPGHIAAGQDANPLQKKDNPAQNEQGADNSQKCFHFYSSETEFDYTRPKSGGFVLRVI